MSKPAKSSEQTHDLPPIPPGFQRVSGTRAPPNKDGKWFIQLRCGFVDTRVGYTRDQLKWKWEPGPGDVVAVAPADSYDPSKSVRPVNGSYQ